MRVICETDSLVTVVAKTLVTEGWRTSKKGIEEKFDEFIKESIKNKYSFENVKDIISDSLYGAYICQDALKFIYPEEYREYCSKIKQQKMFKQKKDKSSSLSRVQ